MYKYHKYQTIVVLSIRMDETFLNSEFDKLNNYF